MPVVPTLRKTEWPLRITEALGIPSIRGKAGPWHSTGDTTDLAWFHAVGDFLGIKYEGERIRAMRAIIEASGGTWDQRRHSSAVDGKQAGGNVRREAFEDLWVALHSSGRLALPLIASSNADALTRSNGGPLRDPLWAYRHIRLRQGQPVFRRNLMAAYGNRCAISEADIPDVLEAAHICPYSKGGTMEISNGLLLRADLHTMFDLGLLAVDTQSWAVLIHRQVSQTRLGAEFRGRRLRLPARTQDQPSADALNAHRSLHGL